MTRDPGAAPAGSDAASDDAASDDAASDPNAEQARAWNGDDGQHWATYRDRYDAILQPFSVRLLEAAELSAGDRVLDVGCGSGQSTLDVARAVTDGLAVGVDLSTLLLEQARSRAAQLGPSNVAFRQADAQVQPLGVARYDTAISRFGVMFFADPAAAFANIATSLRPGGRLAFVCWQEPAQNEWLRVTGGVLAEYVDFAERADGEPGPFSLADPDRIRRCLDGSGFGAPSLTSIAEPMWLGSDVAEVIEFIGNQGPVRSALDAVDPDRRRAALDGVRAALGPYERQAGVTLQGRAWLVTAQRG